MEGWSFSAASSFLPRPMGSFPATVSICPSRFSAVVFQSLSNLRLSTSAVRISLSLFFSLSLSLSFLCSQGTLSGIDSEVNTDLNVFQEIFSRTPSNFLRTRKKLVCPAKTKSKSINAKMISGLESCSPKVLIARVAKPMFLDHADNLYLPTLILQLYIMHPRTKKSFLW